MEIYARNVNDALYLAVVPIITGKPTLLSGKPMVRVQESRNGTTFEYVEPVLTHYYHPEERVLFSPARDANPFLHFFETLWMLAGRNDLKFIKGLVPRFAEYSDDGRIMQGAYGHRWRKTWYVDQLVILEALLRKDPDSRRAVLQMWDPQIDMVGQDAGKYVIGGLHSKDIPCNTCAYFKLRDGKLRMTVCCRSNDMMWGAYGANVVHFSMLQEYLAGKLGVEVGEYIQMSDSLHVYTGGLGGEVWARVKKEYEAGNLPPEKQEVCYMRDVRPYPMDGGDKKSWGVWDADLTRFFYLYDQGSPFNWTDFKHPWWRGVVAPLWAAHAGRDTSAASRCEAADWRASALAWLQRRGVR